VFFALAVSLWIDIASVFAVPKVDIDAQALLVLHHLNLFLFLSILAFLSYLYVRYESGQRMMLIEESTRDPMTQLYNRRYIKNKIAQADGTFGILLIDIDHFKQINDHYGHLCGDKVIMHVAKTIEEAVSPEGLTARWGGEEFLVFFEHADETLLTLYARRIVRMASEVQVSWHGKNIGVTVTVGGAVRRENAPFEITLMRADEALYLGKSGGRDQFHIKA
jgi:diguanylate cyclase (GGDEF)-like protein